jgi:hypothetical protein
MFLFCSKLSDGTEPRFAGGRGRPFRRFVQGGRPPRWQIDFIAALAGNGCGEPDVPDRTGGAETRGDVP